MKNMRNQPKASNKKLLGIVFGLVVLVLLSIGGYLYYRNWKAERLAIERRNEVETLIEDHLEAKASTSFDEYVETLSDKDVTGEGYTKEELAERYEVVFGSVGVDQLEIMNKDIIYDEEADSYSFSYDASMTTVLGEIEPMSYQSTIEETEESKVINWNHSLIFPDMEEGDTVKLSYEYPNRGSIYDRNGNMLAGEGDAYEAGLYPAALGEGEEREGRLSEISETYDVTVESLEQLLSQAWVTEESFVPFKIVDVGETPEVPGVLYQQTNDRLYPLGEAAAHLIGYVGDVSADDIENNPLLQTGQVVGKNGLEHRFDKELRGEMGGQIVLADSEGETREVIIAREKTDGESLTLTINSDVQAELYDSFESEPGSASLMDPKTGELLALTSSPSFDPQLFSRGISQSEYDTYNNDENQPFLNRITARYAPGSTFKIVTSLILLDTGVTTPDKVNTIEGLSWSPDREGFGDRQITRVNDSVSEVDLTDALVYSDNIYFAMEALEMGNEAFVENMQSFPFDEAFDLPISMEPAQLANDNDITDETLLADTAYGQGQLLMNTIQQQSFFTPVLNEGVLLYPQLILQDGELETKEIVTADNSSLVRDMLVESVTNPNGTSHALAELGYSVGAKTGTAEIAGEEENDTNGFLYVFDNEEETYSFVGFLEGQRSGDVIERFYPFLSEVKTSID